MKKENKNFPQEYQNNVKGKNGNKQVEAYTEDNDIQTDSSLIIGGGDPNLSPDAGKPLI